MQIICLINPLQFTENNRCFDTIAAGRIALKLKNRKQVQTYPMFFINELIQKKMNKRN